jgi:hypothetical protein
VNWALLGAASGLLLEFRAGLATEFGILLESTGTVTHARATGLRAASPTAPLVYGAVYRAALSLAETNLTEVATLLATVGSSSGHGAKAELETHATSLGALGVTSPGGHDAVDGAGLGVALTSLYSVGAASATEFVLLKNGTFADHGARATGTITDSPVFEIGNLAGDSTLVHVASTLHVGGRAGWGAVSRVYLHRAVLPLYTTTAALRAGTESAPLGEYASDGACTGVAQFGFAGSTALLAAENVGTNNGPGANVGTATTGVRACSPLAVKTDFAINGAAVGVALAAVLKSGTFGAAELRVLLDGALSVLDAAATGSGAGTKLGEFGHSAVGGAGVGVACTSLGGTAGALLAAMLVLGEGLARAGLEALAAGLGAGGPCGPFAHLAVNWALYEEAAGGLVLDNSHVVDVLLGGGAFLAAEFRGHDDALVARLETFATALGALGEFTVVGDDAVNGAGVGHALGIFFDVRAFLATVRSLALDRASAFLGASAAWLGACRPSAEASSAAVDGALEAVAGLGFLEGGAHLAVEGSSDLNTTSAVLGTRGARTGAFAPLGVFLNDAVDGAGGLGAGARLAEAGAEFATPIRVGFYAAVTVLVSSTTGTRALGPLVESVNNAINGALVNGAFTGLGTRGAGFATEGNLADDLAPACLGTGTTGLGALVEASPRTERAVDGACNRVTAFDLLEHRAFLTTVGGSDFDGTVLFLQATATGLGARSPFVPLGNLTVDGARLGVASTYFLKILATLAAVGRRLGDLAKTLLVTSTAGARALGKFTPFGYNAIDRIVLDNGAEVRIYPLRFIALGTTVVVYD